MSEGFDRVKFAWQVTAGVIGTAFTILVAYNAAGNALSNRVTALEVKQASQQQQEQFFHEATDRRFIELREQLKEVNAQLSQLVTLELQRANK